MSPNLCYTSKEKFPLNLFCIRITLLELKKKKNLKLLIFHSFDSSFMLELFFIVFFLLQTFSLFLSHISFSSVPESLLNLEVKDFIYYISSIVTGRINESQILLVVTELQAKSKTCNSYNILVKLQSKRVIQVSCAKLSSLSSDLTINAHI